MHIAEFVKNTDIIRGVIGRLLFEYVSIFLPGRRFAFGIYFPLPKEIHLVLIPSEYTISLFTQPAGGFLTLALVLAVIAFYKAKKDEKKKRLELLRIEELKRKKALELQKKKEEDAIKAQELKANEDISKEVVV